MVFVRNDIIAKRIESLEGKEIEKICIEITISEKKWCITFAYRPPQNDNKVTFFNELNLSLNQQVNKYDNTPFMTEDLSKAIMNKSKSRISILNGHQGKRFGYEESKKLL